MSDYEKLVHMRGEKNVKITDALRRTGRTSRMIESACKYARETGNATFIVMETFRERDLVGGGLPFPVRLCTADDWERGATRGYGAHSAVFFDHQIRGHEHDHDDPGFAKICFEWRRLSPEERDVLLDYAKQLGGR